MAANKLISTKITGYIVWLTCAAFFLYEFLLRTIIGTFQHPIMYDLQLNPFSFSIISSTAYLIIYGFMQIPVGLIVDRYGLKCSLVIASLVCGVSTIGFSMTHSTIEAVFFRMLMGLGSSFGFIALLVAVYDWLPKERSAFFIGLSQFIGTMGPMLAAGPAEMLSQESIITWRSLFFDLSTAGFVLSFFILLFVKNNRNREHHGYKLLNLSEPITSNLRRVFIQKQTWLIAVYSAFVYFFIEYFSENQGKQFLELKGLSPQLSANLLSLAWVGYAIGCPLLGYISDKMNKRKTTMIAAAVSLLVSLCSILYLNLPDTLMTLSFLFLGMGASGQSIGFAIMAEQCREKYLAAGLGFNNAFICLVGAINAPFIGKILQMMSETKLTRLQQEQLVLTIPVIFAIIALVIVIFFINETFTKKTRQPIILAY